MDDGEIRQNCYEVTTDKKMLVELFWDRIKKDWRLARVYERVMSKGLCVLCCEHEGSMCPVDKRIPG